MVIRTFEQLDEWRVGAATDLGDAAAPVCHLVFQWADQPRVACWDDRLVCGIDEGRFKLWLGPHEAIAVPVREGMWQASPDGELLSFGAEMIFPHVYVLNPSLNMPGLVHGYVTLCGVPLAVSWGRLGILLPSGEVV